MTIEEQNIELEKAKINYSAVYRISNEVFTKAACEILGMPEERVEVRRFIQAGADFGKLVVYVYREDDECHRYYSFINGAKRYYYLSPNIHEFKKELTIKNNKNEFLLCQ